MFSEDVVLAALKEGERWFVADHLLRMDARTGNPDDVAKHIADRNDLRFERAEQNGVWGYRFWRIE